MRTDRRFDDDVLPHLNAAYNLARWLMRNDADAEDAVQDACVRALRFIGAFRGGESRAWLLKIVRNVCFSRIEQKRRRGTEAEFVDELHSSDHDEADPEKMLVRVRDAAALRRAIEKLPAEFREVIVMRELEGMSYKAIAEIAEVPIGTVMSRLARARRRIQSALSDEGS